MLDLKAVSTWADWELVERVIIVDFTCVYTARESDVLNVWPAKKSTEILKLVVNWSFFTTIDGEIVDQIVDSIWYAESMAYTIYGTEMEEDKTFIYLGDGDDRASYTVTNDILLASGKMLSRSITYMIDDRIVREAGLNIINIY